MKQIIQNLINKFQFGNNKSFLNFTGNIVYCIKNSKNPLKYQVCYFTVLNSSFSINDYGVIKCQNGMFLDGQLYGQFVNCQFFNCSVKKFDFFQKNAILI